jgi:hypothetical protein
LESFGFYNRIWTCAGLWIKGKKEDFMTNRMRRNRLARRRRIRLADDMLAKSFVRFGVSLTLVSFLEPDHEIRCKILNPYAANGLANLFAAILMRI